MLKNLYIMSVFLLIFLNLHTIFPNYEKVILFLILYYINICVQLFRGTETKI